MVFVHVVSGGSLTYFLRVLRALRGSLRCKVNVESIPHKRSAHRPLRKIHSLAASVFCPGGSGKMRGSLAELRGICQHMPVWMGPATACRKFPSRNRGADIRKSLLCTISSAPGERNAPEYSVRVSFRVAVAVALLHWLTSQLVDFTVWFRGRVPLVTPVQPPVVEQLTRHWHPKFELTQGNPVAPLSAGLVFRVILVDEIHRPPGKHRGRAVKFAIRIAFTLPVFRRWLNQTHVGKGVVTRSRVADCLENRAERTTRANRQVTAVY